MKQILLLCLLPALFPSCAAVSPQLRPQDRIYLSASEHFNPESQITDRIAIIPEQYLALLGEYDNRTDYSPYMPTAEQRELFRSYLDLLPQENLRSMKQTTLGIYFVNNFLGAAMTDFVAGKDHRLYTILVVNPELFTRGISDWITFREQSAFLDDDSSIKISVDCGTRYKALLYMMLHESAHILDYHRHITPYVDEDILALSGQFSGQGFVDKVWDSYRTAAKPYTIPDLEKLTPYRINPPKLSVRRAKAMIEKLSATPFVSLYGARSWAEDFADSVTFYHLTTILHQPYSIAITGNGSPLLRIEPEKTPLVRQRNKLTSTLCGD